MSLPHLTSPTPFLTEPGMETTLFFKHRVQLPCFSSTPLLDTATGQELIASLYKLYVAIATERNTGIILDTRTWRASTPWAKPLGLSVEKLMDLNREAVRLVKEVKRDSEATGKTHIVISGTMGPLRDAYEDSTASISLQDAREGYQEQVFTLAESGVDLLSLMTVTNLNEAVSVVQLAREAGLPVVVSFSIESDGKLLGGRSLESAIREVDIATDRYATYFGVNCAHPLRIHGAVRQMSSDVRDRIGLIKGNSSLKSHDELDRSDALDRGDIPTYIAGFKDVMMALPNVRAVGGCCGTDEEHLRAIGDNYCVGKD